MPVATPARYGGRGHRVFWVSTAAVQQKKKWVVEVATAERGRLEIFTFDEKPACWKSLCVKK